MDEQVAGFDRIADGVTVACDRRLRRPVEHYDRVTDPAQLHNLVPRNLAPH